MASENKDVIRKFTERLTAAIDYHRELLLAVHLKTHQASLETMLAEQFTFNSAVLWEGFLSDILLTYVVMSPKTYLALLEQRVTQSLKERFGSEVVRYHDISFPSKINRGQAKSLIDPKQFNITVRSATGLAQKANDLLAAKYAKKFTLIPEDAHLVDFSIAIRNYLGHRSSAARETLKAAVQPLAGANADLQTDVRDVGSYLKHRNAAGDTRAIILAQRLIAVASKL